MRVISIRSETKKSDEALADEDLQRALLGDGACGVALPPIFDVLGALLALGEGRRTKALLPLGTSPAELVLVRRGSHVLVSYVALDGVPEPRTLDRPVLLATLLMRCASIASRLAAADSDPISRTLTLRLAERAQETTIADHYVDPTPITASGGALSQPGPKVALAFGFEAEVVPAADPPRQGTANSDVHALLFRGRLWLWARGRRIALLRGPIALAAQRMVAAVRALVEAWEASRPANVRLRAGSFVVGVRLDREMHVALTLGSEEEGVITVPELSVEETALAILRLASDLVRALVSVDRSQSRNLRVVALRDEVRALRRRVRAQAPRFTSIVNDDAERLRASALTTRSSEPTPMRTPAPRMLRFALRWEQAVEELDAASTFLCGDRLLVVTPRQSLALAREDGRVLWSRPDNVDASFMAGSVLVRLSRDGLLTLSDPNDGEPYAETVLAARTGALPARGIVAGGGAIPPVVIVSDDKRRLSAVDLRNGELRWRYGEPGSGSALLSRAGRIVVVSSDDAVSALDVASGELLWRVAAQERFVVPPVCASDIVLVASERELFGIDLFSGRVLWQRQLDAAPAAPLLLGAGIAAIALGSARDASLAAFSPHDGELRFMVPDPGAALGGACLVVDRLLVVNAPAGRVAAISLDDGTERWSRRLSHPVADDVPRKLEPVLRSGALFVPSAQVHVLRPHDGSPIGEPLPTSLVPDWMRVDEHGWVYVAEESGHLCALAPLPQLALVR